MNVIQLDEVVFEFKQFPSFFECYLEVIIPSPIAGLTPRIIISRTNSFSPSNTPEYISKKFEDVVRDLRKKHGIAQMGEIESFRITGKPARRILVENPKEKSRFIHVAVYLDDGELHIRANLYSIPQFAITERFFEMMIESLQIDTNPEKSRFREYFSPLELHNIVFDEIPITYTIQGSLILTYPITRTRDIPSITIEKIYSKKPWDLDHFHEMTVNSAIGRIPGFSTAVREFDLEVDNHPARKSIMFYNIDNLRRNLEIVTLVRSYLGIAIIYPTFDEETTLEYEYLENVLNSVHIFNPTKFPSDACN